MNHKNDKQLLRVFFLTRKWPPAVGGMETYSRELTTDLSQLVRLTVRALPGRTNGDPPSLLSLTGFILFSAIYLWWKRHDYDVIHLGDFVLFPLAWWHALWVPRSVRIITVHGLDLLYGNRIGFKSSLYRRFIAWAQKRRGVLDHLIANSRNTAALCESAGFRPVTSIPLGVRLKKNTDSPSPTDLSGNRYILFVGRLVRRKGAKWFTENVLHRLPEDVKFYVVGKTWDTEEHQALHNSPRVKLLGYLSDDQLNTVRRNAMLIVMPNIRSDDANDVEGFGITALEAAAIGTPLVAANTEGLTDAVKNNETGFLVNAQDVEAWVSQIRIILKWDLEKRQAFRQHAHNVLKLHYSWHRVAKDTVAVYKKSYQKNS